MLRTAQLIGLVAGVGGRNGSVGPAELAFGGFPHGTPLGRTERQDATVAFHHDSARIGGGFPHQRDAARRAGLDLLADPFGAAARFSETASGQDQPDAPMARRRQLLGTSFPAAPLIAQDVHLRLTQLFQKLLLHLRLLRGEPVHG